MKKLIITVMAAVAAICARGQGTFVFDQQSVTDASQPAGPAMPIQTQQPSGQSFTPSLSTVGFIRLYLNDQTVGGSGSTVDINLWSGSIGTGTLLDSTSSAFVADGTHGYFDFFFSTPVSVTSGATYYFQPFVVSGDSDNNMFSILKTGTDYPNGTAIINGSSSTLDLAFREGILVPEPSIFSLSVIGFAGFCLVSRHRRRVKP